MRRIIGRFDPLARRFGYYTAYTLSEDEHIATVDSFTPEDYGYSRSRLAALKHHWETNTVDTGSFRKVDLDNPRWQWHIHTFSNGDIASHYELRPDLRPINETLGEMKDRLERHYRPNDDEYIAGDTCPELLELRDST